MICSILPNVQKVYNAARCCPTRATLMTGLHPHQVGQDTGGNVGKYRNVHVWDKAPVRLFNLKNDPHEKHDLTGERPKVVQRLKQTIEDWH